MNPAGTYECLLTRNQQAEQVVCTICDDCLEFRSHSQQERLDFADLQDFRLPGYRLVLTTAESEMEISQLGHDTEAFFEQLWCAYMKRSKDALFAEGETRYSGEGDFAFAERGEAYHGIAKTELLPDAILLCPHNHLARRIPLCFTHDIEEKDYAITLSLDTGDQYCLRRIGRDTKAVFEMICKTREGILKQWQQAHQELDSHLKERLGEREASYHHMLSCGCTMTAGLYRLDGDGFWFVGLKNGKAAVELVTQEQTATYLYTYDNSEQSFLYSLRHAMESVGLHREVIYTDIGDKPLYRMTVDRSYHLRFLREHNHARIIHNAAWEKNIAAFFA